MKTRLLQLHDLFWLSLPLAVLIAGALGFALSLDGGLLAPP